MLNTSQEQLVQHNCECQKLHNRPKSITRSRIIQTIAGTRLDHGGTSICVPAICDSLLKLGADVHLVSAWPVDRSMPCSYPNDKTRVHLANGHPPFRSLKLNREFKQILGRLTKNQQSPLVHDNGVWLASNHAVAAFCKKGRVQRIVSPHGMLCDWAFSHRKWKKSLAWRLFQRRDLTSATAFHATSQQEADDLRTLGFHQPIGIVPNGVQFPTEWPKRKQLSTRRALFMSRIHPKKGLLLLVEAWKNVMPKGWELVIAGPSEIGHQKEVEEHAKKLGIADSIKFPGIILGQDKWQAYADSDLFVLPSFNENYGLVIAEAMAAGLAVITTKGTPWSMLQEQGMGWWIDTNVEALTHSLKQATSISDDSRNHMGAMAANWARSQCSWDAVAQQMLAFYDWILGGNRTNKPEGFVLARSDRCG